MIPNKNVLTIHWKSCGTNTFYYLKIEMIKSVYLGILKIINDYARIGIRSIRT